MRWVIILVMSCLAFSRILQAQEEWNRETRIAIIGAGASGLTAAATLQRLGYPHVTVYEKEAKVGGKVYSVEHSGTVYEMGAFWAGNGYKTVDAFAQEYQLAFEPEEALFLVQYEGGAQVSLTRSLLHKHSPLAVALGYYHWQKVQKKFASLREIGAFAEVRDPDLYLPFSRFVETYHIEVFAEAFRPFWVACGYGYYEEVPALYVLKLMLVSVDFQLSDLLSAFLPLGQKAEGGLRRAPQGYQKLWEKVGEHLPDVRLGQAVRQIERKDMDGRTQIEVITAQGRETYDALLISTEARATLAFLDTTARELNLLQKVKTYRFLVHLFEADAVPYAAGSLVLQAQQAQPSRRGHVTALLNRAELPNVWLSVQTLRSEDSLDQGTEILRQDLKELGAQLGPVLKRIEWSYFPHVSEDDLRAGFYSQLEALQGQRATYWIGGLMDFEAVENTAAYAQQLVQKHFTQISEP